MDFLTAALSGSLIIVARNDGTASDSMIPIRAHTTMSSIRVKPPSPDCRRYRLAAGCGVSDKRQLLLDFPAVDILAIALTTEFTVGRIRSDIEIAI